MRPEPGEGVTVGKHNEIKAMTKPQLERVMATILDLRWSDPAIYGCFLAQTYHHICHSTRLLAAAGARFTVEQDAFHLQCMKHASEERSHEKLSISDLKALGKSISDFPELGATKALFRSAYCMIDRESPLTLFGYAYFLECVGVAGGRLEEIVRPLYGANAVKHLSLHAKEDPGHIEAYEDVLDTFKGGDRAHIIEAISTTASNYERIYHEIAAWAKAAVSPVNARWDRAA